MLPKQEEIHSELYGTDLKLSLIKNLAQALLTTCGPSDPCYFAKSWTYCYAHSHSLYIWYTSTFYSNPGHVHILWFGEGQVYVGMIF